jgi:tRNA-Thr(GGU) m(6)t(6)A37 methyltransferase TsaA
MSEIVTYRPIGTIHSPFTERKGMPIQPPGARGVRGKVIVAPQFQEGLKDLDGFSHIYLLYHFHCSQELKLTVTPFMDTVSRGLFATRAPCRPNAIGLSVVKLIEIRDNILTVEDIDILDGTPLLDIKPFVPCFDVSSEEYCTGWIKNENNKVARKRADSRFR